MTMNLVQPKQPALDGTMAGLRAALVLAVLLLPRFAPAQDIDPAALESFAHRRQFRRRGLRLHHRRHLLDPVLRIQNGQFDVQTIAVKYI